MTDTRIVNILNEKLKGPFLSLEIKGINGWCMAHNPEFGISSWGLGREEVINDLYKLIIRNAIFTLKIHKEKKEVPSHLLAYSQKVVKNKYNIEKLFIGF